MDKLACTAVQTFDRQDGMNKKFSQTMCVRHEVGAFMKEQKKESFFSIFQYYQPYKWLFFSDMFCAFLEAGATLIIPMIVRHITGTVVNYPLQQASAEIWKLGLCMIALCVLQLLCHWYTVFYGHLMGTYQERDMRSEIYGHLQKLSFAYYDNAKVGNILSRVTSDLFEITELLHHGPEDIVISFIKIVGSFIILCTLNVRLALVSLGMAVLMLAFALIYNQRMTAAFRARRAALAEINGQIEDSLSGIRVVKSFSNEEKEIAHFETYNDRYVQAKRRTYRYMAGYDSCMVFFTGLITVLSVIIGGLFMADGSLAAADLVAFLLYINNFIEPIRRIVNFTETFQSGYSGYMRFREIMAIDPDITDAPDAKPLASCNGDVVFDHVSFRYADNKEFVLKDINLHVRPGEYVALCGGSGAGKTTLCSLIPRFYDVSAGAVRIDGQDVRSLRQHDLRNQIGIVQQDVYLFAGTVIDNIRYGRPEATDRECIEAARAANAHEFIISLPDGYETDIGQRGVKLSGGQKQRISIARVFLKNPAILIFDEATSALDNESERVVQESLESLSKNRTTFVIAHRLSTIRNAKRILVMTEDGIAEEGTHESLLRKNGVYRQLYDAGH